MPALTPEQATQLKEKLKEEHAGPEKVGKWVVTGAHMTWQQMGLSPVDLNILES